MSDQDLQTEVEELRSRLDFLEAAMEIERLNGYRPWAEFVRTFPDGGLPAEVVQLAAEGKEPKASMLLAKLTGISAPFAQVVVRWFTNRQRG